MSKLSKFSKDFQKLYFAFSSDAPARMTAHLRTFGTPMNSRATTKTIRKEAAQQFKDELIQDPDFELFKTDDYNVYGKTKDGFLFVAQDGPSLSIVSTDGETCPVYKRYASKMKGERVFCRKSSNGHGVTTTYLNDPRKTDAKYYPYMDMEKVIDFLKEGKPGIVIFSGEAGTGKSRFVEHACTAGIERDLYLASSKAAEAMMSNMEELKGSIVFVEEGDSFIANRKENPAFKTEFLDATSGITAETYGITWVITTNLEMDQMDKAILRKGRLIFNQEFCKLTPDQVKKAFPQLDVQQPLTLAECFVQEENNGEVVQMRKAIGFRSA